jgi:DNA repair protein RecO (recombination protein O)
MVFKTQGIVLSHLKYGETSLVVTIYTKEFGRKAFLIQGVLGKKSKFHPTFFQPFSLLNIEAYMNPKRDLQRLKEVGFAVPYHSIPFDTVKSTIVLFLSEILYKTLREEEANFGLFEFLYHSLLYLDVKETDYANFHLIFLIQLSKFLGFYPMDNFSGSNSVFDPVNGRFYAPGLTVPDSRETETSRLLHVLLNVSFNDMDKVAITHQLRGTLLNLLVEFYSLHLGGLGNVKSLPVLQMVFE